VGVSRAFSMAARRWYILLPLVLASVGVSWLVYNQIPATYTASVVRQVNPPMTQDDPSPDSSDPSSDSPDSSDSSAGHPVANVGATAAKLAAAVAAPPVAGGVPAYTVTVRPDAPMIMVTAAAGSARQAMGTVNSVDAKLTAALAQLQRAVPIDQRMVLDTPAPTVVAPPVRTTGLRVFVVTLLFGLLLSVVLAAAVERTARRRRDLLDGQNYDDELEPGGDKPEPAETSPAEEPEPSAELKAGVADVDAEAPTQVVAFSSLGRSARVAEAAASSAAASLFNADEAPTQICAIAPIRDLPRVSRSVDGIKREPPPNRSRSEQDSGPSRSVGGLDATPRQVPAGGPASRAAGGASNPTELARADRPAKPGEPVVGKPAVGVSARAEQPAGTEQPTNRLQPVVGKRPEPASRQPVESAEDKRPSRPGPPVRPHAGGPPERSRVRPDVAAHPDRPARPDQPPRPGSRPSRPDEAAASASDPSRRPRARLAPPGSAPTGPARRPPRVDNDAPSVSSGAEVALPSASEGPVQPASGAPAVSPPSMSPLSRSRPPAPKLPAARPAGARPPSPAAGPSPWPQRPAASASGPRPRQQPPPTRPPAPKPSSGEKPSGQRPVNQFAGPDPTTFVSSALWHPVTPAADGVNCWLPAVPAAPLGSPDTAGKDERPRDEPGEQHDQSVERTQEVVPERVEPDGRRGDDEDEFCWPEFDESSPELDESSTVAFRHADEPEPDVVSEAEADKLEPDVAPGQNDDEEHSDASEDDSSPDRRDDHERSPEPAAGY
jgi:hypothetical protein